MKTIFSASLALACLSIICPSTGHRGSREFHEECDMDSTDWPLRCIADIMIHAGLDCSIPEYLEAYSVQIGSIFVLKRREIRAGFCQIIFDGTEYFQP